MPAADLRHRRLATLRALLAEQPLGSQEEIVAALAARGIETTQSAVSRDLRTLGAARVGGVYRVVGEASGADGAAGLPGEVLAFVRRTEPAGPHLVVIRTVTGAAMPVAVALDAAGWPELVGTIAGDDTVFVATADSSSQQSFLRRISSRARTY
jgi:transcriptional regulator of arginine metabolism